MQYTKYFSGILRNHGSLNFEPDHIRLIMNLVHLEGKREALLQVQERFKSSDPPNRYQLMIKSITDQIHELTDGANPKELMSKWRQFSD